MFDHSIKVPRLYKTAAKIAKQVSEGRGSVKQLVYEANHPNVKALYALVAQTFQRTQDMEKLLKKSKLLTKEPRLDPWLAKILITELLWGKKRLVSEAKPIKTVLAYEQILKAHMSDASSSFVDVRRAQKPRYVRVNTLKISTNEVVEMFRDEGWILKRCSEKNYNDFLDLVANLGLNEFTTDLHVPDLLIFPPKTEFYSHAAYKKSHIILQDKASCLPVHILNPEIGSTILDMCAAPGMKTTQIASLIKNQGLVYAVEIREKRYQTLAKIVEECGATSVKTLNKDVTTLTEKDLRDVEYILVDPSCSGSGLTDRVEVGLQKKDRDVDRLLKLAAFQITLLRYALTRFSKAKRVVYSTCSVYPEENEDVVRQVLETCTTFKLVPAGDFVPEGWLNFGSPEFGDIGNFCLYAKPDIDLTSGFFVAVFERLGDGERNQFLNSNLIGRNKFGQNEDRSVKKKKSGSRQEIEVRGEVDGKKKKSKKENVQKDQINVVSDEIKNEEERNKKQKIKIEDQVTTTIENDENTRDIPVKKKKKKHKHDEENFVENDNLKEKSLEWISKREGIENEHVKIETDDEETKDGNCHKKKKKKNKNKCGSEEMNEAKIERENLEVTKSSKKRKNRMKEEEHVTAKTESEENFQNFEDTIVNIKKKRKIEKSDHKDVTNFKTELEESEQKLAKEEEKEYGPTNENQYTDFTDIETKKKKKKKNKDKNTKVDDEINN